MLSILRCAPVAMGLLLSLALHSSADSIAYTFTPIAANIRQDSSQTIDAPALNNLGVVAFNIDTNGPGGGVFTGNGGVLTTISAVAPHFPSGRPAINDAGQVAFRDGLGNGVFAGSGGPLITIVNTNPPFRSGGFGGFPSINNSGTVTFFASLNSGITGVFTGSGGPVATVIDSTGQFSGFFGAPSTINDAGAVAFLATLQAGGSGVFTEGGGVTTTIASTAGLYSGFFGGTPSINSAGTIVFVATLKSGTQGIFAGDGRSTKTIADTTGVFRAFGADPSINDLGDVAFLGFLQGGGEGIFLGPDPSAGKVIALGDPLFGSNVTGLLFGPDGLNNEGQVAFLAELSDGRIAIARADPTTVPEPGPLLSSALGLVIVIAVGRLVSSLRSAR